MVNCEKVWMEDDGQVWTDFPKNGKDYAGSVFSGRDVFINFL